MEKRSIGSFIAVLRKAKGLTQKQLAEQLNVSDKAVSRWERDEALPDLTLIPVLADIFGVTSDELLRGQRNANDTPPPQAEEKSRRQLKYLLEKAKTDCQIKALICVMIAVLGVIAAAILNLAFLRAVAGFWVGCVFFLVAAVLQTIFAIQFKGRLNAEAFDKEALSACKKSIGSYHYWSFTAIIALFSFTLPLAQTPDVYWGLSLRSWLGLGGYFQPILLVLAAAGLLRLYCTAWFKRQKARVLLLIKTGLIALTVMAVTFLGISLLYSTLLDNRQWTGQATVHESVEDFIAWMQTPLTWDGKPYKYTVVEQDPQGQLIEVYFDDAFSIDHRTEKQYGYGIWQDVEVRYVRLNHSVRYYDFGHEEAIYSYTDAQLTAADRIIACIVHPLSLLLPAQLAAAVLIYRKKARKLPAA